MKNIGDIFSPYEWLSIYRVIDKKVQFGRKRQYTFLKTLKSLSESGIKPIEICKHLQKYGDGPNKEIADSALNSLKRGGKFSEALVDWFPDTVADALFSGEKVGKFTESLKSVCFTYERKRAGITPLFASLFIPSVSAVGAVAISAFISDMVLTQIKSFPNYVASTQHKFIEFIADSVQFGYLLVPIIVALFVALRMLLRSDHPIRIRYQNAPLLSVYNYFSSIPFLNAYSLFVLSGLRDKEAIEIILKKSNKFMTWHLNIMREKIKEGEPNRAECINTGLLPGEAISYLKLVSSVKGYDDALVESEEQIFEIIKFNVAILIKVATMSLYIFTALVITSLIDVVFYQPPSPF